VGRSTGRDVPGGDSVGAITHRHGLENLVAQPGSGEVFGQQLSAALRHFHAPGDLELIPSVGPRSAITARAMTTPAAPANPCRNRRHTRISMTGAKMHNTLAPRQVVVPTIRGGRRPYRSESWPMMSCPLAKPIRNAVNVS
jgi:hypothetical protein